MIFNYDSKIVLSENIFASGFKVIIALQLANKSNIYATWDIFLKVSLKRTCYRSAKIRPVM